MSASELAELTPRQLDLITRAARDSNGLVEPLLKLSGGAKVKMIRSLLKRGLIAQVNGFWRLTPMAEAIVSGKAPALAPIVADAPVVTAGSLNSKVAVAASACNVETEDRQHTRETSKQATIVAMLKRTGGVTIPQIVEATGWQARTVRGFFAGALKKKLGLVITSVKTAGGERIYCAA